MTHGVLCGYGQVHLHCSIFNCPYPFWNAPEFATVKLKLSRHSRIEMSTAIWLISYTLFNILLGIHNKWVLSVSGFSFPWLLTSIHILISGIGSFMLIKIGKICKPAVLRREGYCVLAAFSILNALNIAMSNISLNYVSLAIHQMIRSLFPMLNMILDYLLLGRKHHYSLVLAIIPVRYVQFYFRPS